jgi:hypothetical protein
VPLEALALKVKLVLLETRVQWATRDLKAMLVPLET